MQHSNRVISFLYLGFLAAFPLLSFDLFQPALPAITSYFNTSPALGQLTLSLFFFVFGLSQLIWGPLIDHFGRRRTLNFSLVIFLLATIGCIFAKNIAILIVARALQGFAVCCTNVVALSSTRDREDSTERAQLLSYVSMIVSVSPLFAPLMGAIIFEKFGWQATFIFMLILALFLLAFSYSLLKESPFFKPNNESFSLKTWIKVYKQMMSHRRLWSAILIVSMSFSCVMIVIVNSAYLIIDHLKQSPFIFSLLFGTNGVTMIAANSFGIKLRQIKPLIWTIHAGSLLMVLGALIMAFLFYWQGLSLLSLAPVLLINFGISVLTPAVFALSLSEYKEQAGTATALINMTRTTISTIVASLVGTLLLYHMGAFAISLLICAVLCALFCFFTEY